MQVKVATNILGYVNDTFTELLDSLGSREWLNRLILHQGREEGILGTVASTTGKG